MNAVLDKLLVFAILPVELFAALLLYCQPLRHRKHYLFRIAMAVGIILLSTCFLRLSAGSSARTEWVGEARLNWEWSLSAITLVYSFLSYAFAVLLVLFLCSISLPEAIYCATCAYLTQHLTYCIHRLLIPGLVEGDVSTYTAWYFVIYSVAYLGANRLIARRIATDGGYHTKLGNSLRLTASALTVALVLSTIGKQLQSQSKWLYELCLFYGITCCFFVLWGQLNQQRQLALARELGLQQQLWLKHKTQYELSTQNAELINRKCHDLKHQIAALKAISDQTQWDRSIEELEESVMIYDSVVETGNHILDTVLTEKSLICEQRGIKLTCVADGACLDFMDAVDLYTIFGNALDNAIESVSALDDPGKRAISVQVFSRAGLVLIQTENYCEGSVQFDGDLPVTSKTHEQGYHGFGLKSIRYTAEKYDGFVTVQHEQDTFLLRVTIPQI